MLLTLLALTTTRFTLQQDGGAWWIVSPSGAKFVSLGVVIPPASAQPVSSADETATRLAQWHFNTISGQGSEPFLGLQQKGSLYQTPTLSLGASAGAPWKDLWSAPIEAAMRKAGRDQISPVKSDRTIGYFSDQELGWWEGALFDKIWSSAPGSGQRTHFVSVLKQAYPSWFAVLKDFTPRGATSMEGLAASGRLFLKPGGKGMLTVQKYSALVADRYYSLCKEIIQHNDSKALYLGDAYSSNFYPEIAAAAGRHLDVVSTNLKADWSDGTFARFYLPTLQKQSQLPILVSEFSQSVEEKTQPNTNQLQFPFAPNEEERASRAEVATRYLLSQPTIVGAHWFKYSDDPILGRFGLVDASNKPHQELAATFQTLDAVAIHRQGAASPLDALSGIPAAPTDPKDLQTWVRTRGYIPPTLDCGRADLYACYSSDALYLAVYWNEDRFAEGFYEQVQVPPPDWPQIHVRTDRSYVSVSVPRTASSLVTGGAQVIYESEGLRNQVILKIPARLVEGGPLNSSSKINLDVGLATRARAYFGRWRGTFNLLDL